MTSELLQVAGHGAQPRRRRGDHRSVWVCVPTYNEAGQVEAVCRAVLGVFEAMGVAGRVLIVDDDSPDGTGAIADSLAAEDRRVLVLHRDRKEGIGPAYCHGFSRALAAGADLVMEMDCDFSHDPAAIPTLIERAWTCDVVLGSRYVEGGRVERWGLARRALSRGGCAYAQAVLRVGIRDLTGGFKCYRREVLEALPLEAVDTAGYGFQIEMTYRALLAGFAVAEVPITYRERTQGRSKIDWRITLEAAIAVPKLRKLGRQARAEGGQPRRRTRGSDPEAFA